MGDTSTGWQIGSWRSRRAQHQATYENASELKRITSHLASLPPLVSIREIELLKRLLRDAEAGSAFLLQGGDCAETARDCTQKTIEAKFNVLTTMADAIAQRLGVPVVRVGRCAGQYAKPRTSPFETRDGVTLPSYAGDLINDPEFTANGRRHDPDRMLLGYEHAALTLNYLRALSESREPFFTSHEGLHLEYEEAQTRPTATDSKHYDFTTHLPWIGERTRAPEEAHVEFFRGVANPIGVKLGPSVVPAEMIEVVKRLNPANEEGKLILITRLGFGQVRSVLPRIIEAMRASSLNALYVCDPMHGNTHAAANGAKVRRLSEMCEELSTTLSVHRELESHLGGLHVELAGEDVTECVGAGVTEGDLDRNYASLCDPRLNIAQALELARCVA